MHLREQRIRLIGIALRHDLHGKARMHKHVIAGLRLRQKHHRDVTRDATYLHLADRILDLQYLRWYG